MVACRIVHGLCLRRHLPLAASAALELVGRGLPCLCAALALALHLFLDRLALLSLLVCCELLPAHAHAHSLVAERIRPRPMLRRKDPHGYSTVSHGIPCRMRSWLPAPRPPISHLGTEAHKRHRVQRVIRGREDVRSQLAIRFEVEIHLHAPCSPLYVVREGRPAVRCSLMPCCHVIYCLVYLRTRRSSRGSLYPFQVERHLPAVTRHTARHGVERWERVIWLCALAEARRLPTGRPRQNETVQMLRCCVVSISWAVSPAETLRCTPCRWSGCRAQTFRSDRS
jgi:hypothetical protein